MQHHCGRLRLVVGFGALWVSTLDPRLRLGLHACRCRASHGPLPSPSVSSRSLRTRQHPWDLLPSSPHDSGIPQALSMYASHASHGLLLSPLISAALAAPGSMETCCCGECITTSCTQSWSNLGTEALLFQKHVPMTGRAAFCQSLPLLSPNSVNFSFLPLRSPDGFGLLVLFRLSAGLAASRAHIAGGSRYRAPDGIGCPFLWSFFCLGSPVHYLASL